MVKAVTVSLSNELIIQDLLKLPCTYSIVDAKMEYPFIKFTISGYDLPEVKEGEEPKQAGIVCKTMASHIEVCK
jgi:hypothetical protein